MKIKKFFKRYKTDKREIKNVLATGAETIEEYWSFEDLPLHQRMWIATREGVMSGRDLRLFAVWCARLVVPMAGADPDVYKILNAAQSHAEGRLSSDVLREAYVSCGKNIRATFYLDRSGLSHHKDLAALSSAMDSATEAAYWAAYWTAEHAYNSVPFDSNPGRERYCMEMRLSQKLMTYPVNFE